MAGQLPHSVMFRLENQVILLRKEGSSLPPSQVKAGKERSAKPTCWYGQHHPCCISPSCSPHGAAPACCIVWCWRLILCRPQAILCTAARQVRFPYHLMPCLVITLPLQQLSARMTLSRLSSQDFQDSSTHKPGSSSLAYCKGHSRGCGAGKHSWVPKADKTIWLNHANTSGQVERIFELGMSKQTCHSRERLTNSTWSFFKSCIHWESKYITPQPEKDKKRKKKRKRKRRRKRKKRKIFASNTETSKIHLWLQSGQQIPRHYVQSEMMTVGSATSFSMPTVDLTACSSLLASSVPTVSQAVIHPFYV